MKISTQNLLCSTSLRTSYYQVGTVVLNEFEDFYSSFFYPTCLENSQKVEFKKQRNKFII